MNRLCFIILSHCLMLTLCLPFGDKKQDSSGSKDAFLVYPVDTSLPVNTVVQPVSFIDAITESVDPESQTIENERQTEKTNNQNSLAETKDSKGKAVITGNEMLDIINRNAKIHSVQLELLTPKDEDRCKWKLFFLF